MKTRTIFPLTVLAASLSLGYIAVKSNVSQKVEALDVTTYIEMNAEAFSNWTESAGEFAPSNATFWGEAYSFNALDTFFRGETGSTSDTSLMLKPWTQSTQYVYFTWGGAPDYQKDESDTPYNYLKIYCGNENEYVDVLYNNTFAENPMMLKYFKIVFIIMINTFCHQQHLHKSAIFLLNHYKK